MPQFFCNYLCIYYEEILKLLSYFDSRIAALKALRGGRGHRLTLMLNSSFRNQVFNDVHFKIPFSFVRNRISIVFL